MTVEQSELSKIKLTKIHSSTGCKYSLIEGKIETLYKNQEKILEAIKLIQKKEEINEI